jgi:hypothetical protein
MLGVLVVVEDVLGLGFRDVDIVFGTYWLI